VPVESIDMVVAVVVADVGVVVVVAKVEVVTAGASAETLVVVGSKGLVVVTSEVTEEVAELGVAFTTETGSVISVEKEEGVEVVATAVMNEEAGT